MKKKHHHKISIAGNNEHQIKELIAAETARIFVSEHGGDLLIAKRKAAERVGCHDARCMPSNEEIETAIQTYQRVFSTDQQKSTLADIQNKAIEAMIFFERFKPKILGALVNGTATIHSTIYLHLYTDHAEEVDWYLMENKIPHDAFNKTYYLNNQNKSSTFPAYGFIAEETPIELAVFPEVVMRQPIRCSPKGQQLVRKSLSKFKQILGSV